MKNIFVGNISFQTTESDLTSLFQPFGEIARVQVVTDRDEILRAARQVLKSAVVAALFAGSIRSAHRMTRRSRRPRPSPSCAFARPASAVAPVMPAAGSGSARRL